MLRVAFFVMTLVGWFLDAWGRHVTAPAQTLLRVTSILILRPLQG